MKVTIKSIAYLSLPGSDWRPEHLFEIKFVMGGALYSVRQSVDIWYVPKDAIKDHFVRDMTGPGAFYIHVIVNLDEAFSLYLDEVEKHKLCPWTKSEILAAS